ncbi:MAG: AAA family ATPase [Ignavibacteria bacterium]|nr:AAA family ATPase [Ignavibacteria bacterium]
MQIVDAYIEYLRNVSRKITTRNGFIDVLPNETKSKFNYYFDLTLLKNEVIRDQQIILKPDNPLYKTFNLVYKQIDSNSEYKLFCGSGLIHGILLGRNRKTYVCAPLLYTFINLDKEDNEIIVEIDYEATQLNHDLISRMFDLQINDENEELENYLIPDNILEKYNNIDVIENKLYSDNFDSNIIKYLKNPNTIFNELAIKVSEFSNIEYTEEKFDYKKRLNKELISTNKFYPFPFLFLSQVPHQLSTYEALNSLLKQKPINNQLLERLFKNILTTEKFDIKYDTELNENRILEVLNNFIPLSLSENQRTAIIKGLTSEISYIQGPPGTGKSYTITAIILNALFFKKKVLLVSHKKAALTVVKDMVDSILGKNSLLYLGTEDKTNTKEYLSNIVAEADSYRLNLFENTGSLKQLSVIVEKYERKIKDLLKKYSEANKRINEVLKLENEYFNLHKEFLDKRGIFEKTYSVDNIKEFNWTTNKIKLEDYLKAIYKFRKYIEKDTVNRIEKLYKIKFTKHFINKFSADLFSIKENPLYAEDLLHLNNLFSKLSLTLKAINREVVIQLRKNISNLDIEIKETLGKYLPYFYKYNIMAKLTGVENRFKRENISSFRKMLHFKKADILKSKMESINYQQLLEILPFWCSELRDLGKVLPMKNELFDLVIVDEASQVNIAEIIPAYYRGKKYCIVGDKNQLNLNATGVGFSVSKSFEKITWQNVMSKHAGIISYERAKSMNLLVTESSILDFVSSESNDFNIPFTSLDEHFRSLPPLASFTNKQFYDSNWKIMTQNGENMEKDCFKAIKVGGVRDNIKKLIWNEVNEISRILDEIRRIHYLPEIIQFQDYFKNKEKYSIGILSFLTHQVAAIRELIENKYEDLKEKHDIFVATPEEFQGNERDVMFITLGLDSVSKWGKAFYENKNRFNVATSRAKFYTYLIYAGLPTNINLIKKYFLHYGYDIIVDADLNVREENIEPQYDKWEFNVAKMESDFEHYVYKYLLKYVDDKKGIDIYNQVNACGQKRIDFVLYNKITKKTCAVEVDGKDHFINGSTKYTEAHLNRIAVLKRAGWQILNIKYFNWWDNGWLTDESNQYFKNEINRLYRELDYKLF